MDIEVVVEKSNGTIYNPKITELIISHQDPYGVNYATIGIAESALAISDITSHDDIKIYLDNRLYFTGVLGNREINISETSVSTEFPAVDYGWILGKTYVSSLKNWSSPTPIGTILENLRSIFIPSLTGTNISTGPNIASYNIPAWGKTVLQVYQELAKIADYDIFVDLNKDIHFTAKNTTAISGFGVVWGENILSIDSYIEDVDRVINYVKVIGDTGYSAYAEDSASQTRYEKREYLHTDPSLGSNAACQAIADALIQASPPINLSLTITGDLNVSPRDIVNVDIPKLNIDTTFRVTRVEQRIDVDTFETSIDLGTRPEDLTDVIAAINRKLALANSGYV